MNRWIKYNKDWQSIVPHLVFAVFRSEPDAAYNLMARSWFRDQIYSCKYQDGKFFILPHGPEFEPTHYMAQPDLPEYS